MCWPDYYIFSLVSNVSEIIRMDKGHYSIIALVKLYNKSIFEKNVTQNLVCYFYL